MGAVLKSLRDDEVKSAPPSRTQQTQPADSARSQPVVLPVGHAVTSTMLVFQLNEVRMRGYWDCELYADWARLLYLLADAAVFVPIVLYIYFNSKNINFKDWMVDVMIGYRMLNNYWNRNGLYQSSETPQKAHSYKSRVRSQVYTVGQYIEGSRNARLFTVYPFPAYNRIGSGVSPISQFELKNIPLPHYMISILNPLTTETDPFLSSSTEKI